MANEYAIVPEEEFLSLKKDVDKIKDNPLGSTKEGKNMSKNLEELNTSLTGLVKLFNAATQEMKITEDGEGKNSNNDEILARLDNLEKQNEKIAKGIVAVADMFKEFKEEMEKHQTSTGHDMNNNQQSQETDPMDGHNNPMNEGMDNNQQPNGFKPLPMNNNEMAPPSGMNMEPPKPKKKKLFSF